MVAASKVAFGNGRSAASAQTRSSPCRMQRSMARSRATSSMAALRSAITTLAAAIQLVDEPERDVAGAAGEVRKAHARARAQPFDQRRLPQPVQPARHQIVHQVVAGGDRIEHAADQPGVLVLAHPPEAEIGLARGRHGRNIARPPRCASLGPCRNCRRSKPYGVGSPPRSKGAASRGSRCDEVDLRRPLPENFAARIEGRRITGIGRRAKYLLAFARRRQRAARPSRHVGAHGDRERSRRPAPRI